MPSLLRGHGVRAGRTATPAHVKIGQVRSSIARSTPYQPLSMLAHYEASSRVHSRSPAQSSPPWRFPVGLVLPPSGHPSLHTPPLPATHGGVGTSLNTNSADISCLCQHSIKRPHVARSSLTLARQLKLSKHRFSFCADKSLLWVLKRRHAPTEETVFPGASVVNVREYGGRARQRLST